MTAANGLLQQLDTVVDPAGMQDSTRENATRCVTRMSQEGAWRSILGETSSPGMLRGVSIRADRRRL